MCICIKILLLVPVTLNSDEVIQIFKGNKITQVPEWIFYVFSKFLISIGMALMKPFLQPKQAR